MLLLLPSENLDVPADAERDLLFIEPGMNQQNVCWGSSNVPRRLDVAETQFHTAGF